MFTSIYLDNFLGISAPIKLEFISKSRNKDENQSVIKIEDGIYVNKIIGIIGGNASGKTSILTALNIIGNILTNPVCQFDVERRFEQIQELLDKDKDSENRKIFHDFMDEISSSIDIGFQNKRRKNENTRFKIEMYIKDENEELSGFYTYDIKLNGAKKRIEKEYLGFRKKYKEKEKEIINISDSKEGQVYYINRYFKNIADIDEKNKNELEKKYQYTKTFVKHYIDSSSTISTDEEHRFKRLRYIDWYKKSPEIFTTLVRVVDPKIKDVIIDKDSKYEELVFVLKDGSRISRNMLSAGTEKFLNTMRHVNKVIENNGILLVDELEQYLHKELVELIIKLFGEMSKNNSQIIFTTLSPEIFDITNRENKKVFKQDSIFILNSDCDDIRINRLMDIKIDGERVKGDASVANLYKNKKISVHPNEEQINKFLNTFNN